MFTSGLAQLIVNDAQSCDSGEYTCVAVNSNDRISTTGFLTVYHSPGFNVTAPKIPSAHSLSLMSTDRGFNRSALSDRLYSRNNDNFRTHSKFGLDDTDANRYPKNPKFVTGIIADDVATYGGTIALQVRVRGLYTHMSNESFLYFIVT